MKKAKKEKPKKAKKENLEQANGTIFQSTPQSISSSESPNTPSLFQTLTKKEEEPQTGSFVPFSETVKTQNQEKSKLRIIPNSAEIDTKPSSFTPIQSGSKTKKQNSSSDKKELIICKNCGAMLSSDYAFCNKCGSQL